jgi:hypothetical protein
LVGSWDLTGGEDLLANLQMPPKIVRHYGHERNEKDQPHPDDKGPQDFRWWKELFMFF